VVGVASTSSIFGNVTSYSVGLLGVLACRRGGWGGSGPSYKNASATTTPNDRTMEHWVHNSRLLVEFNFEIPISLRRRASNLYLGRLKQERVMEHRPVEASTVTIMHSEICFLSKTKSALH
jgi:hypothetical protein